MEDMLSIFREYGRLERMREDQGLSVEQLDRWTHLKRVLASHFDPTTDEQTADKRSSLRVPSRHEVRFVADGKPRECRMTDISRHGAFLATDESLAIGASIEVLVEIAGSDRMRALPAEVATVCTGADPGDDEAGVGIRFCDLDEQQQELVAELYARAMDDAEKSVS